MLHATFDRIGRNHNPEPIEIPEEQTIDTVSEFLYSKVRRHLFSGDFEVAVTTVERAEPIEGIHPLNGATISVEYGRFGTGIIKQVTA